MAEPMDMLTDHLTEARSAHRRRDWSASYAAFVRADGMGPMTIDDLDAFATGAWLLGHGREAARLAERVYDRLARTDPTGAAMKAAVLSVVWRTRGHAVIASDWAAKARQLLSGAPTSPVRGYLAYLSAVDAVDSGDVEGLTRELHAFDGLDREDAPTVDVLAGTLAGVAALLQGRTADGCRALDGVLIPVLDPRVAPEWGGDVYRLALGIGARYGPANRVLAWAESMSDWSAAVDSAAFRAICQVHLLRLDAQRAGARRAAELRRELADMDAVAVDLLDELLAGGIT
jgi:hypothetical protein